MANDLEMNDVDKKLIDPKEFNTDDPNAAGDKEIVIPDIEFRGSKASLNEKKPKSTQEFTGLTKEELEKFAKDPFWRKLRLILFILFWVCWIGLVVASILIVVFSKKCPEKPKLQFWQKNTGYWVDTMAYSDSNNDGVGDIQGLIKKLDYIKDTVGAKYLILDPIFRGQYSNKNNKFGYVETFDEMEPVLGSKEDFNKLIKEAKKRGIDIVITVDMNSLSADSQFFKDNPFAMIKTNQAMKGVFSRDGREIINEQYYSIFPGSYDIDYTNKTVLDAVTSSLKNWLQTGVMGVVLTNVPVYVEDFSAQPNIVELKGVDKWFSREYRGTQVYSNSTIEVIKVIRKLINEAAKTTDKGKALILDVGSVGYGLRDGELDPMLSYLTKESGADMIISREFFKNRGNLAVQSNTKYMSTVSGYISSVNNTDLKKIAIASATSVYSRPAEDDFYRSIMPFLVPGNPIIYYGSEIGMKCMEQFPKELSQLYPKSIKFDYADKCNHLPMSWTNTPDGGFSNISVPAYFDQQSSARGMTAVGRGTTIFKIYQDLQKLQNIESLQWGSLEWIETPIFNKDGSEISEIFKREATGFKPILVAVVADPTKTGRTISFNNKCPKVKTLFQHPVNTDLPKDEEINADNIYLKITKTPSIYVFQCV